MATDSKRIASIDLFRTITMLMMLWVNDFAGMTGISHAMKHAEMTEDMMGFSDLVFPGFLFCMGLSIPFAIESRIRKGDDWLQVLGHILERSAALLIMGVFSMNCSAIEGVMSGWVFRILMITGYFLLWNCYKEPRTKVATVHRAVGAAILIALVVLRVTHGLQIDPKWWGILGLLGWSYLFSSLIYLAARKSFVAVACGFAAVIALVILASSDLHFLSGLPGGWTHVGLTMTGVFCGDTMRRMRAAGKDCGFMIFALGMSALCLGAATFCHRFWIISKIMATPTWMFYSLSVSFCLTALLFLITDIFGVRMPGTFLSAAGTATLTCYLLPTVWYSVQQLLGFHWPHVLCDGIPGLIKAFCFACIIALLTHLLGKVRVKIKI